MMRRGLPGVAIAALVGASLITAPAASARPTCQSSPETTICQTNGSTSIKVRPGTTAPSANQPFIPWLGFPGRR